MSSSIRTSAPKLRPSRFLLSLCHPLLWRSALRWCLFLALWIVVTVPGMAAGTWVSLTNRAPNAIGLMMLLPDGTVLAQNENGTAWTRLTPDSQGRYATGTWTPVTPMHDTRLYCATQILTDGRLFVAGGEYGAGHTTAEVYDPVADDWTMTPNASATFSDANSEILPDGRVLVALVQGSLRGTIIYNPVTNTWTAGPTANGIHNESMWVKQPDDSILFVDRLSTNSERYIPSLNQWITDASVPVALYDSFGLESGPGFLLPNGKSFFLGATGHTAIYTPSGSTANGSWIAGPDIPNASGTPDAPGAMMPNGKILCIVSPVPTSSNHFPSPSSFYEYDYTTNAFTSITGPTGATLNQPTYIGTMLVVPDGTVLYSNFGTQVYCYQPDGSPLAAGKPTISTITQNTDGSFHLVGTLLNGISEGSAYGDDNQNATNYPIVRLTSAGGTVYRARTFNWSRTSVQTGSAAVSTEFALPVGLPADTYSLTVIANGIASDPASLTVAPIAITLPTSITQNTSASGSVTLPFVPASDTVVNLTLSNSSRLTVPSSVTVLAGQTSASFSISAIEQSQIGATQAVGISAAATGYQTGLAYLRILDDKTAVMTVTPPSSFNSSGQFGGPFSPSSITYTLKNTGNTSLNWSLTKGASWLTVSPSSGSLAAGATTTTTVSVNTNANTLAINTYSDTLYFVNTTTNDGDTSLSASLTVSGSPVMVVTGGTFNSSGPVGGPFLPASFTYTIQNTGTAPLSWTAAKTASWLTLSSTSGTVNPGSNTTVTASINSAANSLTQNRYTDNITFTNSTNSVGNTTAVAALIVDTSVQLSSLDTDPGWTRQGQWAWGTPTGGGGGTGSPDPASGATGTNVFGVNLGGNYSLTPGGPFYLTAGPFNLTGDAATRLRFARWLNTDVLAKAAATVDVSNDGVHWTNVFTNSTTAITDSAWQTVQYDISSVADNQSTVYVRWGYQIASGAVAYSGWNIDDVQILGTTNATAPTAIPQTVAVAISTATPVTLKGVDTNNPVQPLTYNVVTGPQHGTLSGTAPNVTYTPTTGYQGADSLVFTVTNTYNQTSAPATVTFNVSQTITFPAIANKAPTDSPFALTATASSGLGVTYTVVAGNSVATVSGSTVTLTGATGTVTIQATQPGNGSFSAAPPVYQTFAVSNASPFVQIVSSKVGDFSLGIRADGTLWAWGANGNGQLGLGNINVTRVPRQVGTATTWRSVSAGTSFALGVQTNGTLWAWGFNGSGQLGDGTTTQRTSPVQIAGTTWAAVVAGNAHTVAVKSDGTLWAWGANANGQLGQGSTDALTHSSPLQIGTLLTWGQTTASLAAGTDFTLAVKTDGTLWGWGLNSSGQLGDGTTTTPRSAPVQIGAIATWNSIATGAAFSVGTRTDSTIWTWGLNSSGQLGDGTTTNRSSPTRFTALTNVQSIRPGGAHMLATRTDGTLWAWGSNSLGQLGANSADATAHSTPAQIGSVATWQLLAPGTSHSIATRSDNSVWSWGGNVNGALGYAPRLPLPLAPDFGPVAFASGSASHTLVLKPNGTLWAWGSNSNGQLGLGATDAVPHPSAVPIGVGSQWKTAAAGTFYTLAIRADGTLWACGVNGNGQLGDNSTTQRTALVQVGTDNQWRTVSASGSTSLAIKADGTLWGWGLNTSGQVGDGTTTQYLVPTQVGTATNWATVVTVNAGTFTIALKTDGTLWTWGNNLNGELGDGTTNSHSTPVQVGTSQWRAIAGGSNNMMALKSDGTLWGWGNNNNGQLGDGTTGQHTTPEQIGSDNHWTSLAGGVYTVAAKSDGTLWTWGSDAYGQLGDGVIASTNRLSPLQVGASAGWASVQALNNSNDALAISADGTLWGFGYANYGQIGLGWRNQWIPDVLQPSLSPAQTVSFTLPPTLPIGTPVTLAATATSGLPVSYVVTGPATLSGNQLTPTGPGPIAVTAYQPGDNYWQSSDRVLGITNVIAPVVADPTVTAVTTTTATLSGTVNPNGGATTAKFQRGLDAGYGTDTAITLSPGNGLLTQAASTTLTGLTPGTTYHVRITATNSAGTTNSNDVSFTTVSNNPSLSGLALNTGSFSPVFAAGTTNYTAIVPHGTATVTVTPTTQDQTATVQVRINGGTYASVPSGSPSAPLPLGAGTSSIDVFVTAGDGVTTQLYNISATVNAGFAAWASAHGVTGPLSGALSDFDSDGVSNLAEWAFGMNPAAPDSTPITVSGGAITHRGGLSVIVTGSGTALQYSALFGRRDEYLGAGLVYTVQFSSDLQTWVTSAATPTVVADDGEIQAVTVPAPATLNGQPVGYIRLQVTGPN